MLKERLLKWWKVIKSALGTFWRKTTPFATTRKGMRGPWVMVGNIYRGFLWIVALIFLFFFSVDVNLLGLFGKTPSLEDLQKPKLDQASEIYSSDGVLLGKYYRENRSPVEYRNISPWMFKALLATEDVRFYQHSGIDPEATVSILYYLAKGDSRGGSTITQQLAKNLFKTRRKEKKGLLGQIPGLSTLITKSKEWLVSIKLEKAYTKQEIITMYLNTVDFGLNSYGVKTAARTFFNTSPDSLKIEEAALLIGMLKATSSYNPMRKYDKALERRNTVLSQMLKYKLLTPAQYKEIAQKPITLNYRPQNTPNGVSDYYNKELTEQLEAWGEENERDIYSDGLKIFVSIDTRFQAHAQEAVREHVKDLQRKFDSHWQNQNPWVDDDNNEIPGFIERLMLREPIYKALRQKYKNDTASVNAILNTPKKMVLFNWKHPEGDTVIMSSYDSLRYYKRMLHSGIMAMDPKTGQIKAWVGGVDYNYFQYDHVKQSRRQPGSTFKAFVYAAAIDQGYSPCFKIQDKWIDIEYDEDSAGIMLHKHWKPGNANGNFSGMNMSLRHGMGRSINTIAAQLTMMVGPQKVMDYAVKLGIDSNYLKPMPSIGLGPYDVNLYEMVGAYSTFVNEGTWQEPQLITRIEDRNGKTIKEFTPKMRKALTKESAWLMVYMLKGTLQEPQGTAQGLFSFNIFRGNELAGKTGTSQNNSDGWFIGLSKDLVAGVWTGADERAVHFRNLRMGEGSKTALPVYGRFMEKVYADKSLGITMGYFPKATVPITRKYICPTFYPKKDTSKVDSTKSIVDSSGASAPISID